MKYNCLIVDDEELAQAVIIKFINALDSLVLVGVCNNALEAIPILHNQAIDILFVDIKMPELNGLDLIRTLTSPPAIIISTAYSEYAVTGFELSVTDYLLKPFSFERFLKAVSKAIDQRKSVTLQQSSPEQTEPVFIVIQTAKAKYKFYIQDIIYLEGYGNFVKLHTIEGVTLLSKTLTYFVDILPGDQFVRIHKSYIVALKSITKLDVNNLEIKNTSLPIGRLFKKELYYKFNNWVTQSFKNASENI